MAASFIETFKSISNFISAHKAAEVAEFVCKYVDGISQILQSLSLYQPDPSTVFPFLWIMVKQVKALSQTSRYQQVNRY